MAAEILGPYRLLSKLGAGGMGEVWRVLDTRKDREVALKVLGAWLGGEPGYATRFRREAALAARLNAPNIIPIHDYGEIDGRLFMEMPLVTGTNLATLVARQGPLDPMRAVGVIEQVAEALDTAHDAGLVHRDIKPSNVLVATRRGGGDFVYLIDFGIACIADGTRITITGREPGTAAYMAPERFEGVSDPRGDVYALACVLFQMLTGRDPFVPPDGACELPFYVNAHLRKPPPAPSAQRPTVPVAFDYVVARGMAKDPAARFPNAGALAMAARAALTVVAHRAVQPREPELVGVRSRSPLSAIVGSSPAAPAVGRRQLNGHAGAVFAVATAELGGRALAVSGGDDKTVRVWDLATGTPIAAPFTGHTGPVRAVATAQIGGRPVVVSGSDDKTVRVWDLASGSSAAAPFTGHTYGVCAVATTLLGGRAVVVSSSLNDTVRVWDLATGRSIEPSFPARAFAVLAVATAQLDGQTVVVTGGADKKVRVWDLATGIPAKSPLFGHTGLVHAVATAQLGGRPVVVSASHDKTVRVWDLAVRAN